MTGTGVTPRVVKNGPNNIGVSKELTGGTEVRT